MSLEDFQLPKWLQWTCKIIENSFQKGPFRFWLYFVQEKLTLTKKGFFVLVYVISVANGSRVDIISLVNKLLISFKKQGIIAYKELLTKWYNEQFECKKKHLQQLILYQLYFDFFYYHAVLNFKHLACYAKISAVSGSQNDCWNDLLYLNN